MSIDRFSAARMQISCPPPLSRQEDSLYLNMVDALYYVGQGRLSEWKLCELRELMRLHYTAACANADSPMVRQKVFNCLNVDVFLKVWKVFEKRLPATPEIEKRLGRLENQAAYFVLQCKYLLKDPQCSLDDRETNSLAVLNFLSFLVQDPRLNRFLIRA